MFISRKECETEFVKRLLLSPSPVNILLYGAPGAGKTEYAYSIAKECGYSTMLFRNETELKSRKGSNFSNQRLRALMPIKQEGNVIIVDEAENILATNSISIFGSSVNSIKKGTLNKMLDANKNKVIWILNYKNCVDSTTLRRMTYSIDFPSISASYMKSMARNRLDEVDIKDEIKNKLVELYN